jgi:tetratricopeptide (TPR) repeat protein
MLKETIKMDPSHWQPHHTLAYILLDQSRLDEASAEAEKSLELSGGASAPRMMMASKEYISGRPEEGHKHLEILLQTAREVYVPPTFFAWIAMARGDPEEAYDYVRKAIEVRDSWLNFNRIAPKQLRALSPKIESLLKESGWEK